MEKSMVIIGAGDARLSMAAISGRHIAQILCHRDQRPFVATTPTS